MTPGARVQAAIELLDALASSGTPADRLLSGWFRRRRYVGSKDRRAIQTHVYGVLRRRAALDWWLARQGLHEPDGRARLIAALALDDDMAAFDGSQYGPPPLSEAETALAAGLAGQPLGHPEQPDWVRANGPEWLAPRLRDAFGDGFAEEMAALNAEAPVDLRVNVLKADRQAARAALAAEDIAAEPTPISPVGLRLQGRRTLPSTAAFRDGLIEVQDEGSQIAALLVDARPGQSVCDLCAGAGGKTLALAAAMRNQGEILACDADAARLRPIRSRLARAGVTIATPEVLEDDKGLEEGAFDRVLVDAPCSGSGAWRRNPDARVRLTPEELARLTEAQGQLLAQAADLVRPGGRLVYVTCSVLPEENERQVDAFLAGRGGFAAVPIGQVWAEVIGGPGPADGPYLLLTPARHGTDGFFVAVLERGKD
ncbi:MAG: RsmB/NOP family class I SAM-dependent RNA methyltransferase [Alphaproteobacteria bacterium]|nr:RsmB/NOP family class I SAM-dependent RNA methyltransferase [Alphaproteobacteria bacterium]